MPGRQESRTFFDGHGRFRRGDHRRVRGPDDAFRIRSGSQSSATDCVDGVPSTKPRGASTRTVAIASCWRVPRSYNLARRLALRFGGTPLHAPPLTAGLRRATCSPSKR